MKKLFLTIPLLFALVACNNELPELPGVFSVGKNEKVQFSPGLLKYQASTETWRFADSQLDFVGEGNGNISPTYKGWIDLFGYGCTGYNDKYPWQSSKNEEDYAPQTEGGIAGTEYDWGLHCQIQNGGPKGSWRLLSCNEWYYILLYRENAKNLSTLTYIDTVKGLLLLPDGWEDVSGLTLYFPKEGVTKGEKDFVEKNHLTKAQWKQLEKTGAVFLPCTGVRYYPGNYFVYEYTINAMYWCSTPIYLGSTKPAILWITPHCADTKDVVKTYTGYSVRLVKDVK